MHTHLKLNYNNKMATTLIVFPSIPKKIGNRSAEVYIGRNLT